MQPLKKRFYISLGALCLMWLFSLLPSWWIEQWYSRWMYPWLHSMLANMFNALPIPGVYILLILFFLETALSIRRIWRKPQRWKRLVLSSANVIIWLVVLFQLLWGFNYKRVPIARQLQFEPVVPDTTMLRSLAFEAVDSLNALACEVPRIDSVLLRSVAVRLDLPRRLRAIWSDSGYCPCPYTRVRDVKPAGILLRFGTAGFYLPYSAEAHVDQGLHTLQLPFVLAHELAHGQGFGAESECNFWAWYATTTLADPLVRYSGWYHWWLYLTDELRRFAPSILQQARAQLNPWVRRDMRAVKWQMDRYPDFLPALRNWLYNQYLLIQGVEGGMANYGHVVQMVIAWRQKQGAFPELMRQLVPGSSGLTPH